MLAGRIEAIVDGRPVNLVASKRNLVLEIPRLRTLLTVRRNCRFWFASLQAILVRADIRLLADLGWWGRWEVFPNPTYVMRLMLPRA